MVEQKIRHTMVLKYSWFSILRIGDKGTPAEMRGRKATDPLSISRGKPGCHESDGSSVFCSPKYLN